MITLWTLRLVERERLLWHCQLLCKNQLKGTPKIDFCWFTTGWTRCDDKASPFWDDTKSWEHPFHAVVDHQFPLSNLQPTCPCKKVEDFPWMMIFHIASPCFSGNLALKQIWSFYPLISLPSGKHTKNMENHHFQWVNQLWMTIFNSFLYVYQAGLSHIPSSAWPSPWISPQELDLAVCHRRWRGRSSFRKAIVTPKKYRTVVDEPNSNSIGVHHYFVHLFFSIFFPSYFGG